MAALHHFVDNGRVSVQTKDVQDVAVLSDQVSVEIKTPGIVAFTFKAGGNFQNPLEVNLQPFKDSIEALTWNGEDILNKDGIQVSSGFAGGEISIYFMADEWIEKINAGGILQVIDELR